MHFGVAPGPEFVNDLMVQETRGRWRRRSASRLYDRVAIPADSFARTVIFAMSLPDDVDINEILFRPTSREY